MSGVPAPRAPVAGWSIHRLALALGLAAVLAVTAVVVGNTLAYLATRDRYERSEIERAGELARHALAEQLDADRARIKEYAFWEATYQLMGPQGLPDPALFWRKEIVEWIPGHYGDTFIALYDRAGVGRFVWRDSLHSPDPTAVARSGLLPLLDRKRIAIGIARFPQGLFRVAAGTVLPDDPAHAGLPHRGYFVLAQPLADSLAPRMSADLKMTANLLPGPPAAHFDRPVSRIVAGGDSLETRIALYDLFGQAVAQLRLVRNRAYIVQLEHRLVALAASSGLIALLLLLAVYLIARWALVRPVATIGRRIEEMRRSGELRPIDLPSPTHEWSLLIDAFNLAIAMRTESQNRLESLLGSMTDVVWSITPDGEQMLYVNDAVLPLTGYPPDYFLPRGRRWAALMHPDDAAGVAEAFADPGAERIKEFVYRIVRADGTIRWVQGRAWMFRDAAGRIVRIDGITRDITEARELEEHARQAQRLEALGTMAGGIAHDFNNILSAIVGNLEIAATRLPADHPAQDNLKETLSASQRATELVRQILTFSRRREQEMVALRPKPVVEEALRLLRVGLPPTVRLTARLDPATLPVLADTGQLHQVVMNLCTNAWQALESGGGTVNVTLRTLAVAAPDRQLAALPPGDYVHLCVTDTGPGIDDATRSRLFEPFFTTKPAGQGTGLGLAVVHGIVRAHGAQIRVENPPGGGAAFHVYFPAVAVEVPSSAVVAQSPLTRRAGRILFVDDEAPLRHMAQATLPEQGLDVTVCSDGAEALRHLEAAEVPFDLVVTDFSMPGMDGLALLRKLSERRPAMPAILSTGFRSDLDDVELRRLGVRAILQKPYALSELSAAVAQVLAARGTALNDGDPLG